MLVSLIQRLPDTSLTAALAQGGRSYFGWGLDRHIAADIYDATNQTTRAAGNWAKKAPDIPAWPRPKTGPSEKKPVTVRELHARFLRK